MKRPPLTYLRRTGLFFFPHTAGVRNLRSGRSAGSRNLFLAAVPGHKPYTLVFEGDCLPAGCKGLQSIRVSDLQDVQRYFSLLGDMCELYMSPAFRKEHHLILKELKALSSASSKLYIEQNVSPQDCSELLQQVPLDLRTLTGTPLALIENHDIPDAENRLFVHKSKQENVLISRHSSCGDFLYFNMLDHSEELQFDHQSDHVQGLLLLEAMRQASIAATHISGGLPLDGTIILLNYSSMFNAFIELTAPVVIRTYSPVSFGSGDEDKSVFVCCQVFQWGKLCASALLVGHAFADKAGYASYRVRTGNISSRSKKQYDSKISAIAEKPVVC